MTALYTLTVTVEHCSESEDSMLIKANEIYAPNVDTFNHMVFQNQNPLNQQWIEQRIGSFNNILTDVGRQFMSEVRTVYDHVYNSTAAQMARAAVRMVSTIFHPNAVVELHDIDGIRCAKPVMQRYIMANPMLRELYLDQRCAGYGESYVDNDPSAAAGNSYDYRRVTNGVLMIPEDSDGEVVWAEYLEDLHEGDRELELGEQQAILTSWKFAEAFIKSGEDPTDIFCGKIG